jgi:hypothetical protein
MRRTTSADWRLARCRPSNIANTVIYAKITNKRRDATAKRLKTWK